MYKKIIFLGVVTFSTIRYNNNVRSARGIFYMLKRYWRSIAVAFGVMLVIWSFFGLKNYLISREKIESTNICQNEELIGKLINKNINPFSKFKFMKKRCTDCRVLLATNKPEAEINQTESFCSILDDATISTTSVIETYVKDLYDRPSAGKELKTTAILMTPYGYCPQYYKNMIILVEIKGKYGL